MFNILILLSVIKVLFIIFVVLSVVAVVGIYAMSNVALKSKIKEFDRFGGGF